MANPQQDYPEEATKGGHDGSTGEGEAALRAALDEHGEEIAAALDRTDEIDDLLVTAILVIASADDEEIENVTESVSALIEAGDGLATAETADLATTLGENADELSDALDLLLDLQREGDLEELLDTAQMLTALDIDEDTVRGLNRLLGAVGAAERAADEDAGEGSTGLLGTLRAFGSADIRSGLRYLAGFLRALGRGPGDR